MKIIILQLYIILIISMGHGLSRKPFELLVVSS